MKIYKTLVGFSDGGSLFECDTIRYEGQFWLVPEWFESPELGEKRPVRIVALASFQHQEMPSEWAAKFLVNEPVQRDVFEGRTLTTAISKFRVIEAPDIRISIPKGIH